MYGRQMKPKALITIPVYNDSRRFAALLEEIKNMPGEHRPVDVHFLVVDDGSRTKDYESLRQQVETVEKAYPISILRLEKNQGKGGAIRSGFLHGGMDNYDYMGFIDGDGSVPIRELYRALEFLASGDSGVSAVIGSRVRMLGRDVTRNALRHYMGRVFATFVSLYFGAGFYDSQCGLKIFRTHCLRKYIDVPTDHRWVWDTELILAMLHHREVIHEIPIDWKETSGSKLSIVKDPLTMSLRLLSFKKRLGTR